MLSVRDFEPKGTISKVWVHAGAKFGHTGCWSIAKINAVRDHAGSAQVDLEMTARHLQILHQEIFWSPW